MRADQRRQVAADWQCEPTTTTTATNTATATRTNERTNSNNNNNNNKAEQRWAASFELRNRERESEQRFEFLRDICERTKKAPARGEEGNENGGHRVGSSFSFPLIQSAFLRLAKAESGPVKSPVALAGDTKSLLRTAARSRAGRSQRTTSTVERPWRPNA